MTCPVCQRPFTPAGRQIYCCGVCRATAYRRRRETAHAPLIVPAARRPRTVYECDGCGARALGEQRCADCTTYLTCRVGIGGTCPCCDEPVAVTELLGQQLTVRT
jgi:hypothetical protein